MEKEQISQVEVVKFGGVLMGTPANINRSAEYINSLPQETQILTVVSAASGETNNLVNLSNLASKGNTLDAKNEAQSFANRQLGLVSDLQLNSREHAMLIGQIYHSYEQIMLCIGLENFHQSLNDIILSQGERISAQIFTSVLRNSGIDAAFTHAEDVIVTDSEFGNATADVYASQDLIKLKIKPQLENGTRVVLPGFYGGDKDRNITTMPRNSSDLSAAIAAFGLDASVLKLAKGIAGVYNKNPHLHDDTIHMEWLSYDLATEISNNGGKVIYPDVMQLMKAKDIPIVVFDPRNPVQQSIISRTPPEQTELLAQKQFIFEIWADGNSAEDLRGILTEINGVNLSEAKFKHTVNKLQAEEGIEEPDIRAKIRGILKFSSVHEFNMAILNSGIEGISCNFFDPDDQEDNRLNTHK